MEKIYKKNKADVHELLGLLSNATEDDFIEIEAYPSASFTNKGGEVVGVFNMYVGENKYKISRTLKEFLEDKDVLEKI